MPPNFFKPARNSRHRRACLALYRALVREGVKIPLPDDVVAGRPIHPVHFLVKKQFKRNRNDVSPRLVFAALAAGYKFLSLFKHAQIPDSKDHASILSHLREKLQESSRSRANNPPIPEVTPAKPLIPLLVRTSAPGEPPVYASPLRPQPASSLAGRRRIPVLAATSEGVPFLRLQKPQPVALSRMIRFKGGRRAKQAQAVAEMEEYEVPAAKYEDDWDSVVRRLMLREGMSVEPKDAEGTYRQSVYEAVGAVMEVMNRGRVDWIARARAMMNIVEEEKALAKKENEEMGAVGTTRRGKAGNAAGSDDAWAKLENATKLR